MDSTSKTLALILILMMAASCVGLMTVKPANAQTTPKPSVPEFSVKYVDSSYDVPATTSIDPYSGKTVITQGYHVENKSIQISLRNQPFTPFTEDGWNILLCYNVREKGHYFGNWTEVYSAGRGFLYENSGSYTTASYSLTENAPPFWDHLTNITDTVEVDFQVQALIGYVHTVYSVPFSNDVFEGEISDWSNTQTVTISATSASPNPTSTSTATPAVPELSWLVIVPLLLSVVSVAVIFRHRKTR